MSRIRNAWRALIGVEPIVPPNEIRIVQAIGETSFVDAYVATVVDTWTSYGPLKRKAYFRTCGQAHAVTSGDVRKLRLLKVGDALFEVPDNWQWKQIKFEPKPKRDKEAA